MNDATTIVEYDEAFELAKDVVYSFPDFTLTYTGNYQDPLPDNFPNKKSGLFKGVVLEIKSGSQSQTLKKPFGTGIITPISFQFSGEYFTMLHISGKNKKGNLRKIVRGKKDQFETTGKKEKKKVD